MRLDDRDIERMQRQGMEVLTDDGQAVLKLLKVISNTLNQILKRPHPKFDPQINVASPEVPPINVPTPTVRVEPNITVQPPEVNVTVPPDEHKPIKKWQFVVEREYDGRIKTVTATALE